MDIIEQIKAEIERLKGQLIRGSCAAQIEMGTSCKEEAYDEVLSFLSTLESESGSSEIPNDLEEAADKYEQEYSDDETLGMAFIAGAKWQKEQDEEEQADLFTIVALDAAQRAKEQMMKEAVKWMVDDDYHELTEKGRFILGSVGIGYNGYYIPYSDLLKLPKED